jgi:hypothetical protein
MATLWWWTWCAIAPAARPRHVQYTTACGSSRRLRSWTNKLTTVIGRAEERDLVDLLFLERAGLRIEDALGEALAKDGGCTPATLAWVLSEIRIPDGTPLPAGVDAPTLRVFVDDLVRRLRRAALRRREHGQAVRAATMAARPSMT